jgi:hypothetical protein
MSTPLIALSIFFLLFYQSTAASIPIGEDPIMNLVVPLNRTIMDVIGEYETVIKKDQNDVKLLFSAEDGKFW